MAVPVTRVRVLTDQVAHMLENRRTVGMWTTAPDRIGGFRFRIINNTKDCALPEPGRLREAAAKVRAVDKAGRWARGRKWHGAAVRRQGHGRADPPRQGTRPGKISGAQSRIARVERHLPLPCRAVPVRQVHPTRPTCLDAPDPPDVPDPPIAPNPPTLCEVVMPSALMQLANLSSAVDGLASLKPHAVVVARVANADDGSAAAQQAGKAHATQPRVGGHESRAQHKYVSYLEQQVCWASNARLSYYGKKTGFGGV